MRVITLSSLVAVSVVFTASAQAPAAAPAADQKSLATKLNVYVFPGAGQNPAQQAKDETECYDWGAKQSGVDPLKAVNQAGAPKEASDQQQKDKQRPGAKGAVKGAAVGAVVGEVADDDAGKGAAVGAAAGVVAGRRAARSQQAKAADAAAAEAKAANEAQANQNAAFNKAFSACLEAKKYTVKF